LLLLLQCFDTTEWTIEWHLAITHIDGCFVVKQAWLVPHHFPLVVEDNFRGKMAQLLMGCMPFKSPIQQTVKALK